ncbi:MAG: hypothetical protein M0P69_22025 [Bacteroidales bacterium]|nr:hypothetical protein [Bacteroidales bacterium]
MPPQNKIIKYNLEARATELKGKGKPLSEISEILTKESKQTITKSVVYRFFEANATAAVQAVENSNKLAAKVAKAEISTIEQRQDVIKGLLTLAKKADNEHARVQAFKAANDALDSLDKRLGNLSPSQPTQNVIVNVQQNTERLKERMKVYDAIFEEAE